MFAKTAQYKVSQCVVVNSLIFFPVQMLGLFCCALGGYPSQKHIQGTFAFRGIPARQGSDPRVRSLKVLQSLCCEWFGCRILPCCRVQMLPFTAASEPVEALSETVQRQASQCVAVSFLGFVSVQMPGLFCCAFGGYPSQKHIQGTFAFRGIPAHLGSEPRVRSLKVLQSLCC